MTISTQKESEASDSINGRPANSCFSRESHETAAPQSARSSFESESPRPALGGFLSSFHSEYVRLEHNCEEAIYIGSKDEGYGLCGGVIGAEPLPQTAAGKYFEVVVTKVGSGQPDGLAIGVTTKAPKDIQKVPETMDELHPTWLAGFDGKFWSSLDKAMRPIGWNPKGLKVGDCINFLIRPDGDAVVLLNGEVVLHQRAMLTFRSDFYPIIDLLGNTNGVRLKPQAKQAASVPTQRRASVKLLDTSWKDDAGRRVTSASSVMTGFSRGRLGECVALSPDACSAAYTGIGRMKADMNGALIGNGHLPVSEEGEISFTIRIDRVRDGFPDGLAIGVTSHPPESLRELPETIDGVPDCLAVGFKGEAYDGRTDEWHSVNWKNAELTVGDIVALKISKVGQMEIFVNDKLFAKGPAGIDLTHPLYALVDLIGCTDGVTFLPADSEKSAQTQPDAAVANCSCGFSLFGYCKCSGPRLSMSGKLDFSLLSASKLFSNSIIQTLTPELTGFSTSKCGQLVRVSEDGCSASYDGDTGIFRGGVLGNGKIRRFENERLGDCWYYELRVDHIKSGCEEGLSVGVTTVSVHDMDELPLSMDDVSPCWLLAFEGSEWNGDNCMWGPINWRKQTLHSGAKVGVLLTFRGELRILLNGELAAQGTFRVPVETQLFFPVVEMLAPTTSITLLSDAEPPILGLGTLPKELLTTPPLLPTDPF